MAALSHLPNFRSYNKFTAIDAIKPSFLNIIVKPRHPYVLHKHMKSFRGKNIDCCLSYNHHHKNNATVNNHQQQEHQHLFLIKRCYGNNNTNGIKNDFDTSSCYGIPYFSTLVADDNNASSFSMQDSFYLRPPSNIIQNDAEIFGAEFVGTCNGWLCLYYLGNDGDEKDIVLWNPTTNEYRIVPKSPIMAHPNAILGFWFNCAGFGFDPTGGGDYNLVWISSDLKDFDTDFKITVRAELYSLKTDSWMEVPYDWPDVHPRYPFTCVNGTTMYWHSSLFHDPCIMSFNFATKQFSLLQYPESGRRHFTSTVLVEFDGSLGCITYPEFGTNKTFQLYVMEEDGSWTKRLTFQVPYVEKPLGFCGKDKLFFESIYRELVVFDCTTQELKGLGIHDFPGAWVVFPFVKSLVSLTT